MKRIILSMAIFPLLLSAAQKQPKEDQPWYELIKEIKYKPTTEKQIDSLRQLHSVQKLVKTKSVPTKLPQKTMGVYSLDWGNFNAGYAVIEDWRDQDHFYVGAKAATNKFISSLRGGKYKVRDWVLSVGDATGFYPHFFEQHIVEGTYTKDRWNVYDHKNKKVYGVDGDEAKSETLKPYSDNYLSILFNLRNSKMKIGDTLYFPTFVHEKNWDIRCVVLGREVVTVPAGTFNTIKVQPILVGNGQGFNSKDKMYLWFTDDSRRVLVKGQSKARIGHIYAKLYHLETN